MSEAPLISLVAIALGQAGESAPEAEQALESQPADPPATEPKSNWVAPALGALGMVVLIHTLLRAYRRNASKKCDLSKPPRERIAEVRAQADARRDPVERLMAEATELCQRLASQLDAKAAVLEVLIDRADEAVARLERARGGGQPSAGPAGARTHGSPPNPEEPMQRRVFELADQGLSSRDIAARVGQPQGHIELMLNLRRA